MAGPRFAAQAGSTALVAVTLALLPMDSTAQQAADAGLSLTVVSEFVDPKERISGGAVVGASYLDPNASVDLDTIYAHFPRDFNAPVEGHIATADGRYLAEFSSDDTVAASGWQRLSLPTRQHDFLRSYRLDDVAVLIVNADTGEIIPSRWGTAAPTPSVRFQLNAEGARAYFVYYDENDDPAPRPCGAVPGASTFKFDQVCDVPAQQIREDSGFVDIRRKRSTAWGRPIEINVAVDP